MKRTHTIIMICVATATMLASGCKREYGTVTPGAQIENNRDAKVYIDGLTPCWHNNDQVRVNNQTCATSAALGASAQITDVAESSHYRAVYPADIVGDVDISNSSTISVTLPREQQYEVDSRGDQKVKVPMGAYSSNESLAFHNLCPLIKVVISNKMNEDFYLDHITVTAAAAYLSGQCSASVTGSANDYIGSMVPSSAYHDVSLVFPAGSHPAIGRGDRDTYVYYIVAPEFAEDDVTISLYSSNGQYATFERRASLRHNRMVEVVLTVEQWNGQSSISEGALPGLFSISASQQVHFSQGNLQYQASTNTWRFAESQYSCMDDDNLGISSNYDGWIDLFGWGTSGWSNPAECYQPWSVSTQSTHYYPGGYNYADLTGDYAEADWAWHNAISNGGNAAHMWRTLTSAEWDYLINSRAGAASKYGTANIDGTGGLVILPDDWTQPAACPQFNPGMVASGSTDWSRNSYSLAQWAHMEAAGAVFLPAAGYRDGSSYVGSVNFRGQYWSFTHYRDNGQDALCLDFISYTLSTTSWQHRYYGQSVRPVRVDN